METWQLALIGLAAALALLFIGSAREPPRKIPPRKLSDPMFGEPSEDGETWP